MSGLGWWPADRVSLLLSAEERDAVRGDLAESGEGGREALHGLVPRRVGIVGAARQIEAAQHTLAATIGSREQHVPLLLAESAGCRM